MVSSRDRSHSQRRDRVVSSVAKTSPPAFLFPIQRCQRPKPLPGPPLFCAGGRRRRLSSEPPQNCQPALSSFLPGDPPETGGNLEAARVRAPEEIRRPGQRFRLLPGSKTFDQEFKALRPVVPSSEVSRPRRRRLSIRALGARQQPHPNFVETGGFPRVRPRVPPGARRPDRD